MHSEFFYLKLFCRQNKACSQQCNLVFRPVCLMQTCPGPGTGSVGRKCTVCALGVDRSTLGAAEGPPWPLSHYRSWHWDVSWLRPNRSLHKCLCVFTELGQSWCAGKGAHLADPLRFPNTGACGITSNTAGYCMLSRLAREQGVRGQAAGRQKGTFGLALAVCLCSERAVGWPSQWSRLHLTGLQGCWQPAAPKGSPHSNGPPQRWQPGMSV